MTRSNRILNRAIILLVGLVAIAVGFALALPRFAATISATPPRLPATTTSDLWIALGGCVVIVVLCLLWMFSRGRGRTSVVVQRSDEHGLVAIDARAAADLIADALASDRDIVSVGSGAYRMRGQRVLSVRVVARKGVDLPDLIASVGGTVEQLDVLLERRIPVLLQVVSEFGTRTIRTR